MRLSDLNTGDKGYITKVLGHGAFRKRILEMGFVKGKQVEVILNAPLKDPIKYKVMDYEISLRRNEADLIEILPINKQTPQPSYNPLDTLSSDKTSEVTPTDQSSLCKTINIAFVGNPNSGKTSLFNCITGAKEHVGNYSGVTVDSTLYKLQYKGYTLNVYDLPGTYSLTAYTPEERYVRNHISNQHPDIIVNVADASNLERNLYLTTQLMDMDQRMILALNMYDEFEKSSAQLDIDQLSTLLGMPIVTTAAKYEKGIDELLESIIDVYEGKNEKVRHIHVNHGIELERNIKLFNDLFKSTPDLPKRFSPRYMAIKFLEKDEEIETLIQSHPHYSEWVKQRASISQKIEQQANEDITASFADAKYAFISGALHETYSAGNQDLHQLTKSIDQVVTSKLLGYPIFLFLVWVMFKCTFSFGQYPMDLIETGVQWIADLFSSWIPAGMLHDLIIDGIIGGVGGVIVFLPNILILYFFISFMEDSGYMARVAFIMDKLMHKIGLHGKSFIPLIMGFGCTVPSIMASRTIEDPKSRLITILINPLISCSARLPIYILIVGTFFPKNATMVLMLIYGTGVFMAIGLAKLFSKYVIKGQDYPFVMELPPYRVPTLKNTASHMWEKTRSYLSKMGGVILLASIIIWFLGYFPRDIQAEKQAEQQIALLESSLEQAVQLHPEQKEILQKKFETNVEHIEGLAAANQQKNSFIGQIGVFVEPIFKPLGFNWKINVALISGVAAKEIVVSTLGVLYASEESSEEPDLENTSHSPLSQKLKENNPHTGKPDFTPLIALSFIAFVLTYFPCIATVSAVIHETNSVKWGLFTMFYTTFLDWILAFLVYQIGLFFI